MCAAVGYTAVAVGRRVLPGRVTVRSWCTLGSRHSGTRSGLRWTLFERTGPGPPPADCAKKSAPRGSRVRLVQSLVTSRTRFVTIIRVRLVACLRVTWLLTRLVPSYFGNVWTHHEPRNQATSQTLVTNLVNQADFCAGWEQTSIHTDTHRQLVQVSKGRNARTRRTSGPSSSRARTEDITTGVASTGGRSNHPAPLTPKISRPWQCSSPWHATHPRSIFPSPVIHTIGVPMRCSPSQRLAQYLTAVTAA